jgi:transposase InsO family protein
VHECFHANWLAGFGVPAKVTTDRGAQFTSALWTGTCTSLGIKHVLTTAYHPQSNGMVECMHRQIKDALFARGAGPTWHSHLPWVLMGLSAVPKEDSAVSSAELVTGTPLILPGQLLPVPDPPWATEPGPEAWDHLCGPPEGPQRPQPSVPCRSLLAGALSRSRPLLQSSLLLHEATDWGVGAPVEDRSNIFILKMCLTLCRL